MAADHTGTIVQIEDIHLTYPGAGEGTKVLGGVSLEINQAETVAVVGPSGCGKSTLLNIVGGLLKPTAGSVTVAGRNPYELSEKHLAAFRNTTLGFVFQAHHLLPQCTALENVLVPTLALANRNDRELTDRAKDLLDRVGLADRAAHKPARLSGGERQRIAVARALINQPTLLLADEPTGALDEENTDRLAEILHEINQRDGVTLLIVTHAQRLAERQQRTVELRRGKVHNETVHNEPPAGAPA